MVVGPPGAGKTLLVAKLMARLDPRRGLAVSVDAGNAAGIVQLEDYIAALGAALAVADDPTMLRTAISGAQHRTIIIDTPPAIPGDTGFEDRLREWKAAAGAEIVLALPADLDVTEAEALGAWAGSVGAKLLIATRLDLVRRIGGVLAAADAGGLAPIAASLAPHFAYGLKALTPALLARRILTGALDAERWKHR